MAENKKSSISQASSYEEIGEFWDTADFTDHDNLKEPDVVFEIRDSIRIEAELLSNIEKIANAQGIGAETLINLWLQEKVQKLLPSA